jgi:uncharacterized membrane protein
MTDPVGKRTYTFFMPGEERILLQHFHTIAIALLQGASALKQENNT